MNTLSEYIDHTLLRADAVSEDIEKLCDEAVEYSFKAVCINPHWVPLAKLRLGDSGVNVCSVTGFPLGASSTESKLSETLWCLDNGAQEVDTVINIGEGRQGNWAYVKDEISRIADAVHVHGAILKVILENCLLDEAGIVAGCLACVGAGADFVKTSTGFSSSGATEEDVRLMVETVAGRCRVKAAGGVRNTAQALRMIEIGAVRLGTSAGVAIVTGAEGGSNY